MELTDIEPELIESIWQALTRTPPSAGVCTNDIAERIVDMGWVSFVDLEDFLLPQDRRFDPRDVIEPFSKAMGLAFRWAFPRPKHRGDVCHGSQMLSAADAAALCILLERLGFRIDVSVLSARILPKLSSAPFLTDSEISVLFYEQDRHRCAPLTLSVPIREWNGHTNSRFKTPSGYQLDYVMDRDGRALSLTVHSPKYRKRSEPKAVTCPDCGMHYLKGSREDAFSHRSFHRKRLSILEPKPHRRLVEALKRDRDAAWVDAKSPKWKRAEVCGRAGEFRREFEYDFVPWSIDAQYDPAAIGFLFVDDGGRIVGSCAFRPQSSVDVRSWRLAWIWMSPSARRQGHLTRQWDQFRRRFGIFDIEPPISEAMNCFLRKRGYGDLIQ